MAKAGRPKNLRPNEIRLHVPIDADAMLKNKAKRIYWVLMEMEKKMSKDITSVRAKDYSDILNAYEEVCNALRAKGYIGRYAQKRMDNKRMAKDRDENRASEMGGNGQTSVGTGISPTNPLA